MIDIVDYKVPFGILGQLVQPFLVRPKLEEIFEYRKNALDRIFGKYKG
jgi:ligand-binding SRPBCC domain-containing protein